MQAAPLDVKVALTRQRIREWVEEFGTDHVYVSFSGGKDSTVLLHIVREMYPDVPAVFCDTGLEYPEIRNFVKGFDNVVWLKPEMTFRQTIEKFGYPFIGKEVSQQVYEVRKYGKEHARYAYAKFLPDSDYNKKYKGVFCLAKYSFLLSEEAPRISHKCCSVMKKSISKRYGKETGRVPITGQMASESLLRAQQWMKNGCNAFESKIPVSNPLSFWLENDILQYIKDNNIPICSVYGDIIEADELPGQMTWDEYAGFDIGARKLTTTGCRRTGCMFCGFGCHLEKPGEGRFELMKTTHPKQYEYIMKPWEEGGLGFKEVIDWINTNGGLNIRY